MNEYAFRSVNENPVILDFSKCRYLGEVFQLVKNQFGLPLITGENWSGIYDFLRDCFYDETWDVEIHGFGTMSRDLREACSPLLEIFRELHEKFPDIHFKYIS